MRKLAVNCVAVEEADGVDVVITISGFDTVSRASALASLLAKPVINVIEDFCGAKSIPGDEHSASLLRGQA